MSSSVKLWLSLSMLFGSLPFFTSDISEASLRAADAEQMRIIVEGDAKAQNAFMHDNFEHGAWRFLARHASVVEHASK